MLTWEKRKDMIALLKYLNDSHVEEGKDLYSAGIDRTGLSCRWKEYRSEKNNIN